MGKIFCAGSHYNCECPYCGKSNTYICQGVTVAFGKVKFFEKPCEHCKKTIYYSAQYEIRVNAEKAPIR